MIGKKDEGGLQGVNNVQTFNLSGGQMDDWLCDYSALCILMVIMFFSMYVLL